MCRTVRQWQRPTGGFLVIMLIMLSLQGCASVQQSMGQSPGRATTICAAGGALVGAAAGAALAENRLLGALIGGVAGAVTAGATCFAIARAASTQTRDYQQTQQVVGYQPTQGTVVRVDRLSLDPASVAPGEEFLWRSEYVVMAPDPHADLTVVETRILSAYDEQKREWKELGRIPTTITAKPGSRQDEAKMTMPTRTTAQRYQVTFQVAHNNVVDQKSQEMFVATRQSSVPPGAPHLAGATGQEPSRVATKR
jgi:hypothetical protein